MATQYWETAVTQPHSPFNEQASNVHADSTNAVKPSKKRGDAMMMWRA